MQPYEESSAPPRTGWLVAIGVLLLLVGFAALSLLWATTLATVVFLGVLLLIGGIAEIAYGFASARGWRGFGIPLLSGSLAAILGVMFMVHPGVGAGVLTMLVALLLLVSGLSRVTYAAAARFPHRGWAIVSGLAAVGLGIIVLAQFPASAMWVLGLVVAMEFLFRGALWLAVASWARRLGRAERGAMPAAA